ncbi:MAG: trypsin-like peptidase domain-containing protein [Polyangiales bacterium]
MIFSRRPVVRSTSFVASLLALALAVASPTAAFAQAKPSDGKTTITGATVGKTTTAPPVEKTSKAKELSEAVIAVAEKISPSVVQIDVTVRDDSADAMPWWLKKKSESIIHGNGSGVIISSDGYILTNNHVVEDALSMTVRTKDGKILPAKIKGRDPATDLAVIKIDAQGLISSKLGDSDAAKVGEWVVAVGSPFGLSYSVTSGVVSAKGRGGLGMNAVEDYLQTDASINPGNSGGPLVNLNGEVLGINTMIVGRGSGIGFAVPSNMCKRVVEQIMKNGKVVRAWLGVGVQDLTPDLAKAFKVEPYAGVLINETASTGPAAQAKIVPGDIISKVAGKPVHESQDLIREVINHDVGTTISIEVTRNGKAYETKALLSARPEAPVKPTPMEENKVNPAAGFGITMKPIPSEAIAKYNLAGKAQTYISFVEPNSAADKSGVQAGDAVLESAGTANPTAEQIKTAGAKGTLLMRLQRKEAKFYVVIVKP